MKRAIVTGAGRGIGLAIAQRLAAEGWVVGVLDTNEADVKKAVADIPHSIALVADISQPDSVAAALKTFGEAPHCLVNNAGIVRFGPLLTLSHSDFSAVVNVNLIGTYNAARVFAAACAKLDPMEDGERGAMVFTASVAAFDGQVGQQAYSASKAGVAGMTLPMARDLAQHGIRVCTIAPGIFATPLLKTLPEPVQASLAASIPFPSRLGKPEEFAQLAAHIVSNGHMNGEVIRLDGALRMAPR